MIQEQVKVKIKTSLPSCTKCGCVTYDKVRKETMQSIMEYLECTKCHETYMYKHFRKEVLFCETEEET